MDNKANPIYAKSLRQKDWLYHVLHSVCNDNDNNDRCYINVPLTFLLKNGYPYKTLYTNPTSGYVEKLEIIDRLENKFYRDKYESNEDDFYRHHKELKEMRNMLIDHSINNLYDKSNQKNKENYIASVIYNDGEREDFSIVQLDSLMRKEVWRLQVLIIQSFTPPISNQIGQYSITNRVRSKLDSDGAEAADGFTKSLAKYVESAFTRNTTAKLNMINSQMSIQLNPKSNEEELKLTIKDMRACFVLDPHDRVVFLYTELVSIELERKDLRKENNERQKGIKIRGGLEKESDAFEDGVSSVLRVLVDLLRQAERKGLSREDSFEHFDTRQTGFIDTDAFVDGLARLGIGVTYIIGEQVLQKIGGIGSSLLSYQDFNHFLSESEDLTILQKSNDSKSKSSRTTYNESEKKSKKNRKNKIPSLFPPKPQKLPPLKREVDADVDDDDQSLFEASTITIQNSQDTAEYVPEAYELPVPISAYKIIRPDVDDKLPDWMSKGNRRALDEITEGYKKWSKKKEGTASNGISSGIEEAKNIDNGHSITLNARPRSQESSSHSIGSRTSSPSHVTSRASTSQSKRVKSLKISSLPEQDENSSIIELNNRDERLELDDDVTMTFRVIVGAGFHEKKTGQWDLESLRYRSLLESHDLKFQEIEKKRQYEAMLKGDLDVSQMPTWNSTQISEMDTNDDDFEEPFDRHLSFTLIVIPDLFMTLDTLHNNLEIILVKYPLARIVLVGLPGLPNTKWGGSKLLDPDTHALSIAHLLRSLKHTHRLSPLREEPVFFMTFGSGSLSLARFMTTFLPALPWLQDRIAGIANVNGFLTVSKQLKRKFTELRKTMLTSSTQEAYELIGMLHFYEEYYETYGKKEILKEFWSSRRSLQKKDSISSQKGFAGVLEQLRGYLSSKSNFDATSLLESKIPLIIVQSTEDQFINPRNAEMFQEERLPNHRVLVSDVADCLDEGAVYVCWLKAGHEVIQERTPVLLGFISNFAQMCGIHPVEEIEVEEEPEEEDEVFDVLALVEKRKKAEQDAIIAKDEALRKIEDERKRDKRRLKEEKKRQDELEQQELLKAELAQLRDAEEKEKEAQLEAERLKVEHEAALEAEAAQKKKKDDAIRMQRIAVEREKRLKLAEERKRRDQLAKRKAELAIFYEMVRVEKELRDEAHELIRMNYEDKRSKWFAEYDFECFLIDKAAEHARRRKADLVAIQREEAMKAVEDKLTRARQERIREKKKKAELAMIEMESETFELSGTSEDYEVDESNPDRVVALVIAAQNILKDLFLLRQRRVECLQRYELLAGKMDVFIKMIKSIQNEIREFYKQIRKINAYIHDNLDLDHTDDYTKLERVKRALAAKEETYFELLATRKGRERQLQYATGAVQDLKLKNRELNQCMVDRLSDIARTRLCFENNIKELKLEKEHQIADRDKVKVKEIISEKIYEKLHREYVRIKAQPGALVDTDMWNEGVTQRCDKKTVMKFLEKEYNKEKEHQKILNDEIHVITTKIEECTALINTNRRNADKVIVAQRKYSAVYKNYLAVTPVSILKKMEKKKEAAMRKEATQRALEFEDENKIAAEEVPVAVLNCRNKDMELRNKDERKFIGMDMILNPDAYAHVSIVEAEQMRFDDDYQCELSAEKLLSIQSLPWQPSLALPFLRSEAEIEAHRVMNYFLRGKSDHSMDEADFNDLTSSLDINLANEAALKTLDPSFSNAISGFKDLQKAEEVHHILVREVLRDRVRAKGEGEQMTIDEREWLQIDHILSPHVFGKTENPGVFSLTEDQLALKLNTSSMNLPQSDRVTHADENSVLENHKDFKKDTSKFGDLYQEMRWRYENGEIVFDYSWRCPFTKKQLMEIFNCDEGSIKNEDAKKARRLMNKYYVSDKESVLGRHHLKALLDVSYVIRRLLRSDDQVKEEEFIEKALSNLWDVKVENPYADHHLNTKSEFTQMMIEEGKLEDHSIHKEEVHIILKRIWGTWEETHPASAGIDSQTVYFTPETHSSESVHPASYAIHEEVEVEETFEQKNEEELNKAEEDEEVDHHGNDPKSKYFVTESIHDLACHEIHEIQGKIVMEIIHEPLVLLDVPHAMLRQRQSRSHRFEIVQSDVLYVNDVTITITYQGVSDRRAGRLAAQLFRLPDETMSVSSPIPIGYSPYSMQTLQNEEIPGRIVILHRPKNRPIRPGSFQIVIGCPTSTNYTIKVCASTCRDILPMIDEEIENAKRYQIRLPICQEEIDSLWDCMKMNERKLLVCEKMIEEAALECRNCLDMDHAIRNQLDLDDTDMVLLKEERKVLERELGIYEIEYGQWAGIYESRCKERLDIKSGLKEMAEFQRQRFAEKKFLRHQLDILRKALPTCCIMLKSYQDAVQVAVQLNTIISGNEKTLTVAFPKASTPAQDVRRRMRKDGFESLSLDEQKWCLLDQVLNRKEYEWYREELEEENERRRSQGKAPKQTKYNAAVEKFRLKKTQIEYIIESPVSNLDFFGVAVRKLLATYHDDEEKLKNGPLAAAYGFDPKLAERTRVKDPRSHSKEEREWSTVDRILHPEVWKYYVNKFEGRLPYAAAHRQGKERDKPKKKKKIYKEEKKEEPKKGMLSNMFGGGWSMFGGKKDASPPKSRDASPSKKRDASPSKSRDVSPSKSKRDSSKSPPKGRTENSGSKKSGFFGAFISKKEEIPKEDAPIKPPPRKPKKKEEGGKKESKKENKDKSSKEKEEKIEPLWTCEATSKDEILRIWATPIEMLESDNEKHTLRLLLKFNGTYEKYMGGNETAKNRKKHAVKLGSHIKWENAGKIISTDIDFRSRQLLNEIERVSFLKDGWASTDILMGSDQRYPAKILRSKLETEIDNLLRDEIMNRERYERARKEVDYDSDGEMPERPGRHTDLEKEKEEEERKQALVAYTDPTMRRIMHKVAYRAKKREIRKMHLKHESLEEEVVRVRRFLAKEAAITGNKLAEAIALKKLGRGACKACLTKPCTWKVYKEEQPMVERKRDVDKELERVRLNFDKRVFESVVALSAVKGGTTTFSRDDLIYELMHESAEITRQIQLSRIDKEFHDCMATTSDFFEVKALHGYPVAFWIDNARTALDHEHTRLIAYDIAKESIETILDRMLESWQFGEFKTGTVDILSELDLHEQAQGYQEEETPGKDKSKVVMSNRVDGDKNLKVARDGNKFDKALNDIESTLRFGLFSIAIFYFRALYYIRMQAKAKLKAARKEQKAKETAMIGYKEVKPSIDDDDDDSDKEDVVIMTEDRLKEIEDEKNAMVRKKKYDAVLSNINIGNYRRMNREREEMEDSTVGLQELVYRQKLEANSITSIQKVFRGHLGRKAAKRWALKYAEFTAMFDLLSSCQVCIARCWKGYITRVRTINKRLEMASIIALKRAQETSFDEEVYWETHPYQRFKRDQREWYDNKFRSSQVVEAFDKLTEEEEGSLLHSTMNSILDDKEN